MMNLMCKYRQNKKFLIEANQLVYSHMDYYKLRSFCTHKKYKYQGNDAEIRNIFVCYDCKLREDR